MAVQKISESASMNDTSMEVISDRELVISRTLNGPVRIVFDAWTKPELVKRWWAPKSLGSVASCDADVRVGGAYRYVMRTETGDEVAFSGKYTEVTPHSRLVYTQVLEQTAESVEDVGHVVVTVTFDEQDGKTRLVSRELYPSKKVFDAMLESGMEHGMREAMDQLDELVASLN